MSKSELQLRNDRLQQEIIADNLYLSGGNSDWLHPNYSKNELIFGDGNEKIQRGVANYSNSDRNDPFFDGVDGRLVLGLNYGKIAINTCPGAGECMTYCYANSVEKSRSGSMAVHAHNTHVVFGRSVETIKNAIETGIARFTSKRRRIDGRLQPIQRVVVRMGDSGDVATYNEMRAWVDFASENADVLVYGYTKSSFYLYRILKEDGCLPDNFRLNNSQTDNPLTIMFQQKIKADFPEFYRFCHIWDTVEAYDVNIPFNNEEIQAIGHETSEFAIAIHGTFKKFVDGELNPLFVADKFYHSIQVETGIKVC